MGYAGASHPFLSIDELDREISWSIRNPWRTGLAEVLGTVPSILMPRLPDLRRPAALEACRRHGFLRIGVAVDGAFRTWTAAGGLEVFSFFRVAAAEPLAGRRTAPPRGDLFLVLDLGGLSTPQALKSVLDTVVVPLLPLVSRFSPAIPGGEGTALTEPVPGLPPGFDPGRDIFPAPLARDRLSRAAPLSRKRRKKAEEYQRLLALLSPPPLRGEPIEESGPKKPAREELQARLPVAHMLGEVTLAGNDFDVRLAGGRFLGITRGNLPLLPLRKAASYLRTGGRTHVFRTRGSFSFETASGTGLREELMLEGPGDRGGSLAVEYSFRDDSPLLSIRAEMTWPRMEGSAPLEECVPFAIVLREVAGPVASVESTAPDGSTARFIVRERDGWMAVPGARQEVALEGGARVVLCWEEEQARRWGLPFFRVGRCLGRKRGLEVSPFGCGPGTPARWLSGRTESFLLLLGVSG